MIILASSSITRAKMLEDAGISFTQKTADFDEEQISSTNPREFVYLATKGKMDSAIKQFGLAQKILCADTVVVADNEILRKATTVEQARKTLKKQSGNSVSIITCTMLFGENLQLINLSSTRYKFAKFDDKKIESYLQSNEWQGKAGACMVEGFCKEFIVSVDGYESTAKGITLEAIMPFINS